MTVIDVTRNATNEPALGDVYRESIPGTTLLANPWQVLDIFRRRRWAFILAFVGVLGPAIAYANLAPRTYDAYASVMIQPRFTDPLSSTTPPDSRSPAPDFVESQMLLLDSPQLSREVAKALHMAEVPDKRASATDEDAALDAAASKLRAETDIRQVGTTPVIAIIATTDSPELSAAIANEFARQYLNTLDQARNDIDNSLNSRIDSRLEQLRRAADTANRQVQEYAIRHGLMSAEGATMAEQEASTLNQQVAQARADLAEKQGRLAAARRQVAGGGGGEDSASALSSGTIGSLRSQEAEASRNLAELRTRYGPRHPAVAQQEKQLADIRQQIQLEIGRIMSSLQGEVNVASSRLSSLLASQSQSRSRLASNAAAEVGYSALQSKAAAAKTIYEAYLNRSRAASASDGLNPPVATIQSTAIPPSAPSGPNTHLIYLLGMLFAVAAGIGAVGVTEFWDGGVSARSDVERKLGARYLGAIPELGTTVAKARERPEDYIISHPLSSFAEAFRNLRAAVTLRDPERTRVFAVSSALPLEGKTTTAICLARTFALAGEPTVLVDCDLRRHSASNILLPEGNDGLGDVLAGRSTVRDAVQPDSSSDLHILGTRVAPSDGRDVLTSRAVDALLRQLRDEFRYIIIDTAPVLGVADARAVAGQADSTILLARWRKTYLRSVDTALDLLLEGKAKVSGVALTIVNVKKFGSRKEELYGYHKDFHGYYSN